MMEVQDGAELCFPQLLNTSCKKPVTHLTEALFLKILLTFIIVLTVALNLFIIISISHFRQLHTPTNLFLLSLAVSDFLVGLLEMPEVIFLQTSCWVLGDIICLLCNYKTFLITGASIFNMVLISVDRYVAICDPLHYTTKFTLRRVKLYVCLCWLYSFFYAILCVKDEQTQPDKHKSCQGECVIVIDYISGIIDLVFSFIVPITIIIILYMRVFAVAVSQARAMRAHVASVKLQVSLGVTSKKSELKAARTLGVLVVVFLICLFPYYIICLLGYNSLNSPFEFSVLFLFYFNSCLNPLIYALLFPCFRKAIKLILTLQILQPGSCEANIL
ncbi:hypothetical protein PAMP_003322 [Pampus punctatissimus]